MSPPISISLSPEIDNWGNPLFILKIQKDDWEINVSMTPNELMLIPKARTARWDERGSIRLGECAGASTFWSCQDGNLSILVGHDDECWDFGVWIPEGIIDEVIAEIERETKTTGQYDGKH
jgi:hypothetical protein